MIKKANSKICSKRNDKAIEMVHQKTCLIQNNAKIDRGTKKDKTLKTNFKMADKNSTLPLTTLTVNI